MCPNCQCPWATMHPQWSEGGRFKKEDVLKNLANKERKKKYDYGVLHQLNQIWDGNKDKTVWTYFIKK